MHAYCLECHRECSLHRLMETGYYDGWVLQSSCCRAPAAWHPHGPQITDEEYQVELAAERADRAWQDLDERDR